MLFLRAKLLFFLALAILAGKPQNLSGIFQKLNEIFQKLNEIFRKPSETARSFFTCTSCTSYAEVTHDLGSLPDSRVRNMRIIV